MDALEAIMTRVSLPKVTDRELSRAQITKLLDAAVRAPNHHLTEPWRFVVLTGSAREELGAAWAVGEADRGKDPEPVRAKPLRAPAIITVIARPKQHLPKVLEIEEHHAVGAALQNILLAAHAMGLGAMIRTGKASEMEPVRRYLGLADDEYIAGFIYVGYPEEGSTRPPTRRTPAAEITEWRGSE